MIAGKTFCLVYGMDVAEIAEPSKAKAIWLTSQEYGLSESQINNYIRNYRKLLPLCAAYSVYAKDLEENISNPNVMFPDNILLEVVTLARKFWEWGKIFKDRNGRPFVDEKTWEPPLSYLLPMLCQNEGKLDVEEVRVNFDVPYVVLSYPFEEKLKKYQKK